MFIKGISFFNYKKFKKPTEISFEDFTGRIGILGNNGSGKSSLLDVIPIALYGVDAVTGKKEHLRTQGLVKDTVKLRLEFAHMGKNFLIERVQSSLPYPLQQNTSLLIKLYLDFYVLGILFGHHYFY